MPVYIYIYIFIHTLNGASWSCRHIYMVYPARPCTAPTSVSKYFILAYPARPCTAPASVIDWSTLPSLHGADIGK